jgi:hypothetical protein
MAKREESKPKQIKISAGAPARVLTTEEIAHDQSDRTIERENRSPSS